MSPNIEEDQYILFVKEDDDSPHLTPPTMFIEAL